VSTKLEGRRPLWQCRCRWEKKIVVRKWHGLSCLWTGSVADTSEYSSELVMPVSPASFSTSWATIGLSRTLLHIVSYFWEKIFLVWVDQVDLWHLPWWVIFTTFEKGTAWIKQWSTAFVILICTYFLATTWKWTQHLTFIWCIVM
jgi:hypothetical protein